MGLGLMLMLIAEELPDPKELWMVESA